MSTDRETAPGRWLESMTWIEAEPLLAADGVVAIPLGAAAKEHGPHLPLDNDARIANWLAATLLVWIGSLIAAMLIPRYVFTQLKENKK